MEPKFTKGPWRWEGDGDFGSHLSSNNGDGDVVRARWGGGSSAELEVSDGDKHLIAAAPDMYAALEVISSWLCAAPLATPEDMAQNFKEMLNTADAALSRAPGETK